MSLQTLKNKAFRVSIQWNALVRKPLSLERGGFTDASKEFVKEGKKNKLKEHNREKILKTYTERKAIKHFCALASMEQIKENDYNLSVNRYVEQEDTKEIIDIKALNAEISQIVERQSALRNSLDCIIKELEEGQHA